ncbi:MAG: endonuclease/exonuclease/phosphatase family protein [Cyanobacteria bacterium J06642_9]
MLTATKRDGFALGWQRVTVAVCSIVLCVGLGVSLIPQSVLAQALATPESTVLTASDNQLTVAAVNVKNLNPGDGDRFEPLAHLIVDNLAAPDVVTLVEIQDNDGSEQTLLTAADQTYGKLIAAIQAADGPTYTAVDIAPQRNRDGGPPGGNSRVGYLFRPDRLTLAEGTNGDATTTVEVLAGPHLSLNPGRIAPNSVAFRNSRKPLTAEFVFNGQSIFLMGNHFTAQGDAAAVTQRRQQAKVVNSFVAQLLAADGGAKVVVLGDLNDDEFSALLKTITGNILANLVELLPPSDRYSFDLGGSLRLSDYILVSPSLWVNADVEFDIVHSQVGFPDAITDHDPVLARFNLPYPDAPPDGSSQTEV